MSADRAAAEVYEDLVAQVEAAEALIEHAQPAVQRCVRLAGDLPLSAVAEAAGSAARVANLVAALRLELRELAEAWTTARWASSVGGGA